MRALACASFALFVCVRANHCVHFLDYATQRHFLLYDLSEKCSD